MRSRYPAFIPLTLSTSVAFQFRTEQFLSIISDGRKSAVLDGNFIGGAKVPVSKFHLPRASPIFHTFIRQFGKLRSTLSLLPRMLDPNRLLPPPPPTDERKTVELFIFFQWGRFKS